MADNPEVLRLDLGERGGQHRFRSVDEVNGWIDSEFEAWRWIANDGPDRFNLWNHISSRLTWLREAVQRGLNNGQTLSQQEQAFQQVFGSDTESVLHSQSDLGRTVIDILESEGSAAALGAYGTAIRRLSFNQLSGPAEIRGGLLISLPSLINSEAVRRVLTQERRNLRDRAERLIQSLEEQGAERQRQYRDEIIRGREVAFGVAKRRFARWARRFKQGESAAKEASESFGATHKATQEDFNSLKAAFLETMRLKAPATYWSDKAMKHKAAEGWAMWRLVAFFPTALIGLALVFWRVGTELLRLPSGANDTALFVVASAALATLAGITFWVGRLMTKLYLSEHHLRIDAEEREIMTTTYLALTKDAAATDADRGIILAALFRNTPDGIVKDDGSVDVSLASLLSKVGLPTR